jgi:alkylation response protein AidB-like acyl-CoA dehydrogenase
VDFEFSADQEALRDTVRRFLADRAPLPWVREQLDDERGTTDEVWKGLAELGATGLLVPEAHGGAGLTMVDMGVVLEEMGRVVHPGPFTSSAVGAVSAVLAAGTPDDHARFLPGLADGSVVGTLALDEPGRRHWRESRTTATATGESSTITGTKVDVADGAAADLLLVAAAAPEGGLGLFAVERDAAGVEVTSTTGVDGSRKFATVSLSNAPARRVGAGDATEALAAAVDRLLVAWSVDGVGAAEAAFAIAVAYAKERMQFDKPIGAFQAVQHLCAEMLQQLELGRAGAYFALWTCDAATPAERHRAAVMAKAYTSDVLWRIGANTIQVLGGIGFTWEHDAHLFYKRLLSLQQAMGSVGEHLDDLAGLVLD